MQSPIIQWLRIHTWAIEVVAALLFLLLLNFGLKKLLAAQKRSAHLKEGDWRYHLDYAALIPSQVFLWILLVSFLVDLLLREAAIAISIPIPLVRNVGIILCFAWFLLRWKKVMAAYLRKGKHSFDPLSVEITGRLFTIGVVFLSLLIILQLFGLDVGPLIAFGGVGAAALGFASKDVIANFFGGVMVSFTRPFTVGDLVELPEKQIRGHIEQIGWYLTSLRDLQKRPIYVPNWLFATELVVNESRMTHRCLQEVLGIRYEDVSKVETILEEATKILESHSAVDRQLPFYFHLQSFAASSVQLEVKAYLHTTQNEEFIRVRQEILLAIYALIIRVGAEMPFPRMTVDVKY